MGLQNLLVSFTVPLVLTVSGQNFIQLRLCYLLQFLPNVGLFSSVWAVFFVGLDRLLSVHFPFWYSRMEQSKLYLLLFICIASGYSLYVLRLAMDTALFLRPNHHVLCGNGDVFTLDNLSPMLLRNGLIINGASLGCYSLVWLTLRRQDGHHQTSLEACKHRRLFKSLAAIMILVVGSYFAVCVIKLVYASVESPFFQLHILPCISALLTCTAATSNPPLLFAFSNEYRRAFRTQFQQWPVIGAMIGRNYEESSMGKQTFTVTVLNREIGTTINNNNGNGRANGRAMTRVNVVNPRVAALEDAF